MSKIPEIRIKVPHMDRLVRLTNPQLRVWLYYKRREGADGKAFGKAKSIADWAGIEPGTVRNARSWLTKNGWLRPNGRSKSGLPMFLAVTPQLHPDDAQVSLHNDSGVTAQLHPVSLGSETEVPTQKEQPEKDSALTSGSEIESEREPSLTPFATAPVPPSQEREECLSGVLPKTTPEALELLAAITPNLSPAKTQEHLTVCQQILSLLPEHIEAVELLRWNRSHRGGKYASKDDKKLRIRTAPQFLAALMSEEAYLLNDYETHDFKNCELCMYNHQDPKIAWANKQDALAREEQEKLERAEREAKAAARKAALEADAADQKRWKSYRWHVKPTEEHKAVFKANRQFDYKEAVQPWFERKALQVCLDATIVYFADRNQPFTQDEFDAVMADTCEGFNWHNTVMGASA